MNYMTIGILIGLGFAVFITCGLFLQGYEPVSMLMKKSIPL